jgi:hypothetical protein
LILTTHEWVAHPKLIFGPPAKNDNAKPPNHSRKESLQFSLRLVTLATLR